MSDYSTLRCGGKALGFLGLWLVLSCMTASVSCLTCPWPCNRSTDCGTLNASTCDFGTVLDFCGCCDVCGNGPGQYCGNFDGRCGVGLECVVPPKYAHDPQYPGTCTPVEVTTPEVPLTVPQTTAPAESTATGSATSTAAATTSSAASTDSTMGSLNVSTDVLATPTTATGQPPVGCSQQATAALPRASANANCRTKCSVDFCSSRTKHRLCSAVGMEFSRVPERGECQHTSCRACFLHVEAPCSNLTCSALPKKSCLKQYYTCIRNFFDNSRSILNLEDPAAKLHSGRIICHVPQLTA